MIALSRLKTSKLRYTQQNSYVFLVPMGRVPFNQVAVKLQSERFKSLAMVRLADLPTKRAQGVLWNGETDAFGFSISIKVKPITRREFLSTVSSVYDPLGFCGKRRVFQLPIYELWPKSEKSKAMYSSINVYGKVQNAIKSQ